MAWLTMWLACCSKAQTQTWSQAPARPAACQGAPSRACPLAAPCTPQTPPGKHQKLVHDLNSSLHGNNTKEPHALVALQAVTAPSLCACMPTASIQRLLPGWPSLQHTGSDRGWQLQGAFHPCVTHEVAAGQPGEGPPGPKCSP